jgi:hypothetical protein
MSFYLFFIPYFPELPELKCKGSIFITKTNNRLQKIIRLLVKASKKEKKANTK